MAAEEVAFLSAVELRQAYGRRELCPVDVTRCVLERIERLDPDLGAFLAVTADVALAAASRAKEAYAGGWYAPLLGVPFSVSDTMPTRGIRHAIGSPLGGNRVPSADAPAVARARTAGGLLLGKTNAHRFTWTGESSDRRRWPARSSWRSDLTAGTFTGGSGSAVANGLGPLAIGLDTAGSACIQAALCGIVGFEPSFGLVPVAPAVPGVTLAHIGILTRTVRDAALALTTVAGQHPLDRHSLPGVGFHYSAADSGSVAGLRVAWSPTLGYAATEPDVVASTQAAARVFEELGCVVEEFTADLGDPHDSMSLTEDECDPSSAEVRAALRERTRWVERLHLLLAPFDVLITPAVPVTRFRAGQESPDTEAGGARRRLDWTASGYPFSLNGRPAITVPCSATADGSPVGLQLIGRVRDDATVLRAAAAYEVARPVRAPRALEP